MKHCMRQFGALIFVIVLIGVMPAPASAQSGPVDRVEINQVDASRWPRVSVFTTALNQARNVLPPDGLEVQVFEDGKLIAPEDLSLDAERTGLAAVILLDLSGSMGDPGITANTRFAEAQQAALDFVNNTLQDGDLVGIVGFATDIYDGNWMHLTSNRAEAASLLQSLTPETDPNRFNTALWEAAFAGMRMFDEHPDALTREQLKGMRRAVVAFTDGNDTVSGGSRPGDLREWANRLGISMHTVGLKSPAGAQLRYPGPQDQDARWLADQTFGSFFDYGDVAQRSEFPAFLSRLASQRDQLRISYPSQAKDGLHQTRVVVSTGDVSQEDEATWFSGGKSLAAAIVEPAPGASFGCEASAVKTPIRLEVQNPDGLYHAIDRVEFYDNDKLIGAATAPPFTLDWDVNLAGSGQHLLTAWLHDASLDEVIKTPAIAVQVASPARPVVQLTEPAAGTTLVRGVDAKVDMKAMVDFPDGCRRPVTVRFRGNGQVLSEQSNPPFTYQWDVSNLDQGQHSIAVEVVDSVDNRLVTASPVMIGIELTAREKTIRWLRANWYVIALALGLLFLLILLLRTRRQVGKAVGGAVARVRQTMMGQPKAQALGTLDGVRGPAQGRSFRLGERINTLGRDPQQCEVVIQDDGYLSSKHLRIEFTDQGALLTDLNSRHGTVVSGQPVQPGQPVPLRGGERIRAGESELEFKPASQRKTRLA